MSSLLHDEENKEEYAKKRVARPPPEANTRVLQNRWPKAKASFRPDLWCRAKLSHIHINEEALIFERLILIRFRNSSRLHFDYKQMALDDDGVSKYGTESVIFCGISEAKI